MASTVTRGEVSPSVRIAREIIGCLDTGEGVSVEQRLPTAPAGWLIDPDDDLVLPGIPAGALDYATGLGLAAAAGLARLAGRPVGVSRRETAVHLLLPSVMAASYGAPDWPRPPVPLEVDDGLLHCDLGAGEDHETFQRLLETFPAGTRRARDVAERAQQWRLAVTDYRCRGSAVEPSRVVDVQTVGPGVARHIGGEHPLEGLVVCDLTAGWSGPLATWLLAAAGAEVVKVEPGVRLDGFRGMDGAGIYPGGIPDTGGNRSALFNALNRSKVRAAWDLRTTGDRLAFCDLVARAHVLIDNFSPRVMPNLGFGREALMAINPTLRIVSMPAFGVGSRHRDWVAYGTGIHAMTGLGEQPDGSFSAPVVSYPDPLCGMAAFAAVVLMVRTGRTGRVEVPLESAARPLLAAGPKGMPVGQPPQLLQDPALQSMGVFVRLGDGAGTHSYPRAPFEGLDPCDGPAPELEPA